MRLLLTLGPTHEPVDHVRYLGNRSSGRMGAAIARAADDAGWAVTALVGPCSIELPAAATRIDVTTAAELRAATLHHWPAHDALVMAAAVADYTPAEPFAGKLPRSGELVLRLVPTADVVAEAAAAKRADQRVVSFSLESEPGVERALAKLRRKGVDLAVMNPPATLGSDAVRATLVWPNGRSVALQAQGKTEFARRLVDEVSKLFVGAASAAV